MPISTYLANKLLDHVLRNTAYTAPATVYVSLHTGDPGLTGANECADGNYARQATAFNAAATKATANTDIEDFPAAAGSYTVNYVGIWDALNAGNFLWASSVLGTPKTIGIGEQARIPAGDLDVTLT